MTSETVYEQLRKAIALGRMHPNERLVEADLTERYGVSRATVRTALVRLEQEGLVEHERNRGAKVRLIDEDEAVEIYEARALLEGLAARKAALNVTDEQAEELRSQLAEIRTAIDAGQLMEASEFNMALHDTIVRLAAHGTASRLLSRLNSQLVRFQYRTILHPGRAERSYREHSAVVEAIVRRDPDGAETAMREHLHTLEGTLAEPIPARLDD